MNKAVGGVVVLLVTVVCVLFLNGPTSQAEQTLGKLFIKSAPTEVNGQQFTDKELEDSVKDLKAKTGKFVVVDNESEADFLLVVVKREVVVGRPNPLSPKTPRNVSDIKATLSVKSDGKWNAGALLSSNGCCRSWSDSAGRVLKYVEDWVKENAKK